MRRLCSGQYLTFLETDQDKTMLRVSMPIIPTLGKGDETSCSKVSFEHPKVPDQVLREYHCARHAPGIAAAFRVRHPALRGNFAFASTVGTNAGMGVPATTLATDSFTLFKTESSTVYGLAVDLEPEYVLYISPVTRTPTETSCRHTTKSNMADRVACRLQKSLITIRYQKVGR